MAGLQPTLAQLRPALDRALETALASGGPLPGRVRNLIRSRRRPPNWLATMRQALEEDDQFRADVAAGATEDELGRLAWLWLTRPEGWPGQVEELARSAHNEQAAEAEARATADRIATLARDLARARADLQVESSARSDLEARVGTAARQISDMERRLHDAQVGNEAALAAQHEALERAAAATGRSGEMESEIARLREEMDQLATRLAEAETARSRAEQARERADADRSAAEHSHQQAEAAAAERQVLVAASIAGAAAAARRLAESLGATATTLAAGAEPVDSGPPVPRPEGKGPEGRSRPAPARTATTTAEQASRAAGAPRVPRAPKATKAAKAPRAAKQAAGRRPLALPPAVLDDSIEAAGFLVRAPGVHLVVDGYNVTFTSWTGDDLPALRDRLVAALTELVVRVHRHVTVVFDGIDDGGRAAAPAVARPWLHIVFSPSSVEADQVIVKAVRAMAPGVPVVVATNDRQVREDVSRLGANVLSVEQLLSVLNRSAVPPSR